jgi:hypothetical protein
VSLLPWWDNYYEPADLEEEDEQPVPMPELLTAGWWSASTVLEDDE